MRNHMLVSIVSAFAATHSAFAVLDLTAWLREKGAENYTITTSGGEEYEGMAKGAFDGDLDSNAGRALMVHGYSENKMQPAIELNLNVADAPDMGFTVTSFRIYRLNPKSDLYKERTTRDFAIQASIDGNSWCTVYRTQEKQEWTDNNLSYRDYEVPICNRGCYSRYRIKMYPDYSTPATEDHYVIGFQELVLYGEIGSVNVLSGTDAKINRDDPQSGIVFPSDSICRVSGSRIGFFPYANILAGSDSIIENDLCNTNFPMKPAHAGWLPRDEQDSKKGKRVCFWRNRLLSEMTFTEAVILYNSKEQVAYPYHVVYGKEGTEVQFQTKYIAADNRFLVFSFKVIFDQDGTDVYGRIDWVKFKWDTVDIGHDFEDGSIAYSLGDVRDSVHSGGYGLKDITATGGEMPPAFSVGSSDYSDSCQPYKECLPQSDEDKMTGKPVLYWRNRRVKDLIEVTAERMAVHGGGYDTQAYCFVNDGTAASVQFQSLMPSGSTCARLCVKVEFTQEGSDVMARVVYAKYDWGNLEPHDFDKVKGSMEIRKVVYNNGVAAANGYSVKNLNGLFKGALTLTGELEIAGDITVNENTVLTLGADSLDLNNSYVGEGTVRFAAASGAPQTVTVTGVRKMGKVSVGGDLRLVLGTDVSLSVADMSVESDGTISIESRSGANAVRVGTERLLGADVLSKIMINGGTVVQNEDGWLARRPGLVITIQ